MTLNEERLSAAAARVDGLKRRLGDLERRDAMTRLDAVTRAMFADAVRDDGEPGVRSDNDFREEDHPRDEGGKFSTGSGGASLGHGLSEKSTSAEHYGGSGKGFDAYAYARAHDDPTASADKIMASLSPEQRAEIAELHKQIEKRGQTIDKHRDENKAYPPSRRQMHEDILFRGRMGRDPDNPGERKFYPGILSAENLERAKPAAGEKPTFTILGGRGGSGKSQFKGEVYDEDKAIVLDADVIKHMIEEFEGWNANEVHEESSDVLEEAMRAARARGLNVVFDATMKSSPAALEKVAEFKKAGYRMEAHYMHLPRQVAAKRAVERYFSPSKKDPKARGRYVPAHVVLGNQLNEKTFNEVRQHADRWSFRDNNVERGQKARLVARGGYDEED
jgi:predicted ABC-type ATPase